jgi:DNA-binding beta-propeller fold protein YncE
VADDYAFRWVDTETGKIWATADLAEYMDPSRASDIAANDEVIAITDVSRARVYMLDRATGEKIQKWNRFGTAYGVVLDDDGNPLVTDFDNGELIQLRSDDRKVREVIASGLDGPVDLVWADAESLYVTEANSGSVIHVTINNGDKTIIASGLQQPEGLALLPDGQLAVVEAGAGQVTRINPVSGAMMVLAADLPISAVVPETPTPVYVPTGIAAGANGVLYITSDRDHSVLRLVP